MGSGQGLSPGGSPFGQPSVDQEDLLADTLLLGGALGSGLALLAYAYPEPGLSAVGIFLTIAGVIGGLVEWLTERPPDAGEGGVYR